MNRHEIDEILADYDNAVRAHGLVAHDAAAMVPALRAGEVPMSDYLAACRRVERAMERVQVARGRVLDAMHGACPA